MSPSAAGGISGIFAGGAALGVVHAMAPNAIAASVLATAQARGVDETVAFGVAYATAAALGAFVGAAFASVTKYLRRFVPLLVWAVIFFVSLTLLLLAVSRTYGGGLGIGHTPAILTASVAYALVVSLALPLRVKR